MYYAVTAQIITHDGDYSGSRQVPLFYLHSDVQGIKDIPHAKSIAESILNPLGLIPAEDIRVYVAASYPD